VAWWKKSAAARATEIELAWRRSLRAAVARDWRSAETWLERIVEADSKDLDATLALARLYREQGAIGRALRMHQNLLLNSELDSVERADALSELARDFEAGGYRERAAATYEELLDLQPRNALVLERLVALLHELNEFPRALALVRRLRRRDREAGDRYEVEILLTQSRVRRDAGDHDGALKSIKRCLKRDKTCALAWMILGELAAERGKTAKALDAWKRGALADAALAVALYPKLAATFAARGKPEAFDHFLIKLLEDRPQDHAARIALARARASRGESTLAIEDLARAIEVAPEDPGLRGELGRQLISTGQEAEALKAYGELLDWLERKASTTPEADGREAEA
jgi:lipopolysaccharide biosynthesis regulator YciM